MMSDVKLPQELYDQLTAPLPPAAFDQMPDGFTSIKDIFVYERLNQVFGNGGWKIEEKHLGCIENLGLPEFVVRVDLYIPEFHIHTFGYGGHLDQQKAAGDNYQSAVTDAFGKCWKQLGIGAEVWKGEVAKTLYPELALIEKHASRPIRVPGTELEYFDGIILEAEWREGNKRSGCWWLNVSGWTVRLRGEIGTREYLHKRIKFRGIFVKAKGTKGVPKSYDAPNRFLDIKDVVEICDVKSMSIPETED